MDLFFAFFCIGFLGLLAMALLGAGRHSHSAHGAHGHAGHDGSHAAAHSGGSGLHGNGAAQHGAGDRSSLMAPVTAATGVHPSVPPNGNPAGHNGSAATDKLWNYFTPRVLFSLCFGFGFTGLMMQALFHNKLAFALALILAIAGGLLFEHIAVAPVFEFFLRFESKPARTLESAVLEEAVAVTDFDGGGNGLISLDLDGRTIQVLGILDAATRTEGTRVRTGDRLFIQSVDPKRNTCVVSVVQP